MVKIAVDRQRIIANRKDENNRPVWSVEVEGQCQFVHGLTLRNARLVSSELGRACWIEVEPEDIECLACFTPTLA